MGGRRASQWLLFPLPGLPKALAMSRERGRPERIGRSAHYSNSAAIYPMKRASHANARGHPSRRRCPVTPLRGPVLRP